MSLDSLIIALIIIALWMVVTGGRGRGRDRFIPDYKEATGLHNSSPGFSSGGRQRVADTVVTDLAGDWRNKFGKAEGKFYARYMNRNPAERKNIENPTYRTAVTF